jgi:hypothetical protein
MKQRNQAYVPKWEQEEKEKIHKGPVCLNMFTYKLGGEYLAFLTYNFTDCYYLIKEFSWEI